MGRTGKHDVLGMDMRYRRIRVVMGCMVLGFFFEWKLRRFF